MIFCRKATPNRRFIITSLISSNSSLSSRPFSISPLNLQTSDENSPQIENPFAENSPKGSKPLSVYFKEVVGILVKLDPEPVCENAELKKKLTNLAEELDISDKKRREKKEIRKMHSMNAEGFTPTVYNPRLSDILACERMNRGVKLEASDLGCEDPEAYKPLSPDMQIFACHLYTGGYLKNASFMDTNKFDLARFESRTARDYLKCAAVDFGKDQNGIAKWLSVSDLKNIASFGCPSLGKKSVKAAKHLRCFFKIDEHQVCQNCILRNSCKLPYKKSLAGSSHLRFGDVTRVLVMYALESVPQQLVVPEEIKNSVSRLLKEIVILSDTVSRQLSIPSDSQ